MKKNKIIGDQEGYSLVETIIAMALFLSVLIPLVTIMGNVMFDRKSDVKNKALMMAVTEMNYVASSKDFTGNTKTTDAGLIIQRNIEKSFSIINVEVVIRSAGVQSNVIVALKRSFLEYE